MAQVSPFQMPIIGQPKVKDFMVTLSIECVCPDHTTILVGLRVGQIFGCAKCKRMWVVSAFSVNGNDMSITMTPFTVPTAGGAPA